jgi:hypothetical protein
LNHIGGSRGGVVGIYQRYDWAAEKRDALASWSDRVAAIERGEPEASNVVALRE